MRPPATACQAVDASSGMPSPHFRLSTAPTDDMTSAARDDRTPHGLALVVPAPTISRTPRIPPAAPSAIRTPGRWSRIAHPKPASASGARAMIEDATELGSRIAET